jgi:hypothetical protein
VDDVYSKVFEGPSVRLSRILWSDVDSSFEGYPTTGSWYTLPAEADLQLVDGESSDC